MVAGTNNEEFLVTIGEVAQTGRGNIAAAMLFVRAQRSDFGLKDLHATIGMVESKGLTGVNSQFTEQFNQAKELQVSKIAKTIQASASQSTVVEPLTIRNKQARSSGVSL